MVYESNYRPTPIVYDDELMHYGVKGMKWGVRRGASAKGGLYAKPKPVKAGAVKGGLYAKPKPVKAGVVKGGPTTSVSNARAAYKSAKKAYNKSYYSAYGYSQRHAIGQYVNKNKKAEANKRWDDAFNKAVALRDAKANYKKTKADYKKSKVSDYSKKYDEAVRTQEVADRSYAEAKRQYKALGKNAVSRIATASKNNTAAAKAYSKAWDRAMADQERADSANRAMKDAYRKTGRNAVSRVVNNARYGK